MESENYKIIKNFITKDEANQIINWLDSVNHTDRDSNHHLTEISKISNSKSYMFDISNTELTNYITKFQSVSNVSGNDLPEFIYNINNRISENFKISKENMFLQAVDMNNGGRIKSNVSVILGGLDTNKDQLLKINLQQKIQT